MNIMKGLYFPDTAPSHSRLDSLLCLLDEIEYYRIVEGEEDDGDSFPYRQGRVVLPLGEQREHFLAMIRDIKAHAADFYGGYLATLSADALVDRDESSVHQLIAGLHGVKKETDPDPRLTQKIWQARLVLRLAEMLNRERLELARDLSELKRSERALFEGLKGELDARDQDEGGVIDTGNNISGLGQEGPGCERLLKAWSVLYAMDPEQAPLLVTGSEEAAAHLFDGWEELTGSRPPLLAAIELPDVAEPEAIPACRAELAEARGAMKAAVNDILTSASADGDAVFERAARLWREKLPAQAGPRNLLELYLLEGHSFNQVWSRLSGLPPSEITGQRQRIAAVVRQIS